MKKLFWLAYKCYLVALALLVLFNIGILSTALSQTSKLENCEMTKNSGCNEGLETKNKSPLEDLISENKNEINNNYIQNTFHINLMRVNNNIENNTTFNYKDNTVDFNISYNDKFSTPRAPEPRSVTMIDIKLSEYRFGNYRDDIKRLLMAEGWTIGVNLGNVPSTLSETFHKNDDYISLDYGYETQSRKFFVKHIYIKKY